MRVLLESGANVSGECSLRREPSDLLNTPLLAAMWGLLSWRRILPHMFTKTVKVLVAHRADVNVRGGLSGLRVMALLAAVSPCQLNHGERDMRGKVMAGVQTMAGGVYGARRMYMRVWREVWMECGACARHGWVGDGTSEGWKGCGVCMAWRVRMLRGGGNKRKNVCIYTRVFIYPKTMLVLYVS